MFASRRPAGIGCLSAAFLLILGVLGGVWLSVIAPPRIRSWLADNVPFAPTPAPAVTPTPTPTPTPLPLRLSPTPTPEPPKPLPDHPILPKVRETAKLYNGLQVRSSLEAEPGGLASFERETPADYALDLKLQIKVPAAAHSLAELARSNPALPKLLPKLGALIEKAQVSKFYHAIYEMKTDLLARSLTRLDQILAPDTFYDTETVLELQDPDTKRKALLIQTRMEVDADGSDSDRLNVLDTASDPDFQPLTSYRWLKRNPAVQSVYLKPLQDRLARLQAEAAAGGAAKRRELAEPTEDARVAISQLQHYSSLIGKVDPFIVLPGFIARSNGHPYQARLGDYAVVIAGDKLYPAIFGDIGPAYKLGEASLRIAQALNPAANANRSPVNDLKITYIVFPNSVDALPGPPDLGKMRARCQALLAEIGGTGNAAVQEWVNLIPTPTPTPTPVPTPTPTPVGTPTPKPTPTLVPGVLPTRTPVPLSGPVSPTPVPAAPGASVTPVATPTPAR